MMSKSSTLTLGAGSAALVNLPSILNLPVSSCSGICGSCGGGCAIVGLTVAGFLITNCFYKTRQDKSAKQSQQCNYTDNPLDKSLSKISTHPD